MITLDQLHADIEMRVKSIRENQLDWQCRAGCDGCCRRLAEIPRLTLAEWLLLREGLSTLSAEQLQEIDKHIAALAEQPVKPIVCPMLDQSTGVCRVYVYRPVACRTYGFYVQRELGLYCQDIKMQVDHGTLAEVVWGNHDVIDRCLNDLGDSRALTEWFLHWKEAKPNEMF